MKAPFSLALVCFCSLLGRPLPAAPPTPAEELLREIRAAVDALRPEYRTVFVLFHEHGQPYEDIAAAVKRPVGTVKTWLHRARLEVLDRLRRRGMVEEQDAEHGPCETKP